MGKYASMAGRKCATDGPVRWGVHSDWRALPRLAARGDAGGTSCGGTGCTGDGGSSGSSADGIGGERCRILAQINLSSYSVQHGQCANPVSYRMANELMNAN